MNSKDEAAKNALMQLGGFDESGRFTVLYDPTSYTSQNPISGFLTDTFEVGLNYVGMGLITSKTQKDTENIIKNKANEIIVHNNEIYSNQNNQTQLNQVQNITLSGHSAGGRRNYISILNSNENQFLDNNNNSVLNLIYYGTPVNDNNLQHSANRAGSNYLNSNKNAGDGVSYILGGNGGILELTNSIINIPSLFEPNWKPNLNYFEERRGYENLIPSKKESVVKPPFFQIWQSPHSLYNRK